MKQISLYEMDMVAGGQPFESDFCCTEMYRAGITYENVFFGADRYYIGKTRISKEKARELMERSEDLWDSLFAESGDLVGFIREWKRMLWVMYGISWDGQLGTYSFHVR